MTTSTSPASTSSTTGQGRSGCGDGVRWYDSTVGRDTLRCTGCEHQRTITVDEQSASTALLAGIYEPSQSDNTQ